MSRIAGGRRSSGSASEANRADSLGNPGGTPAAEDPGMTTRASSLLAILAIALAACGGGGSDAGGDDGGNVGFGGAQDIGQFRSILDQGEIPGEETLDANGFFSEHYSELPDAACGNELCLHPMLSVGRDWLNGAYQATLQIAMTTPIDPTALPRLPLNLVVVVDHSGSMAADGRMDKVKQGLHLLIDSLEPGDRLSLVQFDDVVDVLSTLANEPDPAALHALVDQLYPDGLTNIHAGLETGFQQASLGWNAERQNRLILLSDGLATVGIVDPNAIIEMADEYLAEGMSLTTIGVGLDFDVGLMRGLAEHGAGNFYFLEDAAAVNEVFTEELEYSLTTIALDVEVNAVPAPGYDLGEVIGTRVWRSTSDGGHAQIPAVFVASRVSQGGEPGRRGGGGSIFIDLDPIAGAIDDGRVATVTLSYRLPGSSQVRTQQVDVTNPNPLGELPTDTYVSHQAMMEHYAAYNLYRGLREGAHSAVYSYDCAFAALTALQDSARRFNSVFNDPDVAADILLIEQFRQNLLAHGARPEAAPSQAACAAADPNPYPDDPTYPDDYDDDYYGNDHLHCSGAGSSRSGLAMFLLIGAALLVSRRRRATRQASS
jgi:Ca-activated chloride channel family protein